MEKLVIKKLIVLLSLIIGFACEDDKEDAAAVNIDGTYKLSSKSWDCDGDEDIIYLTISGLNFVDWDYEGDECEDDQDCYAKESGTMRGGEDGVYQFDMTDDDENLIGTGTYTLKLNGKELNSTMSFGGNSYTRYWDQVSDSIKTYFPVCSD